MQPPLPPPPPHEAPAVSSGNLVTHPAASWSCAAMTTVLLSGGVGLRGNTRARPEPHTHTHTHIAPRIGPLSWWAGPTCSLATGTDGVLGCFLFILHSCHALKQSCGRRPITRQRSASDQFRRERIPVWRSVCPHWSNWPLRFFSPPFLHLDSVQARRVAQTTEGEARRGKPGGTGSGSARSMVTRRKRKGRTSCSLPALNHHAS